MNTRMRKSGESELRTTGHEGRACNAETPQAESLKAGGNTEVLKLRRTAEVDRDLDGH